MFAAQEADAFPLGQRDGSRKSKNTWRRGAKKHVVQRQVLGFLTQSFLLVSKCRLTRREFNDRFQVSAVTSTSSST